MLPTDAALTPCVCGLPVDVRAPRFLLECHYCGRWCHGDCERVAERDALHIAKFACATCAKRGHATERYQCASAPLPLLPPRPTTRETEPTLQTRTARQRSTSMS